MREYSGSIGVREAWVDSGSTGVRDAAVPQPIYTPLTDNTTMAAINESDSVTTPRSVVSRVLSQVRDSVLLLLATVGVVEIILAGIIQLLLDNDIIGRDAGLSGILADLFSDGNTWGLWAAVFTIWGMGLILVGVVGYTFVWWRRR